ncbi:hypothetical protein [Roseivivax sp. THAF30]|uniref:hypothetical protein n=1 Tax=Roseivivax sp. THAF30 TaxID=2587852 RepID=UPI001268D56A|nr:hypothetical protein [Roseivivax sp. THAF30]
MARIAVFLGIACVGLGALGGALLYLAPMTILTRSLDLPPQVHAVYGTLRMGGADLPQGYTLTWSTRPGLRPWPGFGGTLRLEGSDTRLVGDLRLYPREIGIAAVSGRAGPGLAQLVPGAWRCGMTARVDEVTLLKAGGATRADGRVTLPAGTCAKGARDVELPEQNLIFSTEDNTAAGRLDAGGDRPLAYFQIDGAGRAILSILEAAADIYPALPKNGPLTLEYSF